MEKRFQERRKNLRELCELQEYYSFKPDLNNKCFTKNVDLNDRLRWCRLPYAASGYIRGLNSRINEGGKSLTSQRANLLFEEKTKQFTFSREPYTRLVRAYFDKMVTMPNWWSEVGVVITENFRSDQPEGRRCGHDVTFPEWIKYFIKAESTGMYMDESLVPAHRFCDVCRQDYDYLGKLETFSSDIRFIYDTINATSEMEVSPDRDTIIIWKIDNKLKNLKNGTLGWEDHDTCLSLCDARKKMWRGFQGMGYIPIEKDVPLSKKECNQVPVDTFKNLALEAFRMAKGTFDEDRQKEKILREMFRQVPIEDREKVRKLLKIDFDLFGYDPEPESVFPEKYN